MSNTDQAQNSTIEEFCLRNRICKSSYFELRRQRRGPREMRVLGRVLISPEAEADWRRNCEASADDEMVERLRERGRKGGRAAAAQRRLLQGGEAVG